MTAEIFDLVMQFTIIGFMGSLSLWTIAFTGNLLYKAFWNSIN